MDIAESFEKQAEYKLFRKAFSERKAPLVIICGSGLSAPAGLPTWAKLRGTLQSAADQKADALNQMGNAFHKVTSEAACKQEDIWVAFKILKDVLSRSVFEQIVE